MGETLGIAHNVFEKMERERDRKERLKKYEEWQKVKAKKQRKLDELRAKIKVKAETGGGGTTSSGGGAGKDDFDNLAGMEGFDDDEELAQINAELAKTEAMGELQEANSADPQAASGKPVRPQQLAPLQGEKQADIAQETSSESKTEEDKSTSCGKCSIQ